MTEKQRLVLPDYVTKPGDLLGISASLAIIVKECADILEKSFPGWLWTINPDQQGGVVYIYSLRLSGEWGYTIKIADIQNDPQYKEGLMAGGEILERYGLKRGPYHRDMLRGKPRDMRDNFIPDITDRHSAAQKKHRDRMVSKAFNESKIHFRAEDTLQEDGTTRRKLFMRIGDDNADQAG